MGVLIAVVIIFALMVVMFLLEDFIEAMLGGLACLAALCLFGPPMWVAMWLSDRSRAFKDWIRRKRDPNTQ